MKKKMKENKLNKVLSDEENIDLRLSYSRVSDFDRNGPQALIRPSNPDTDGIKHGSLVDVLLVDTITGSKEIENQYVIIDENKPTAMLGTLCDIILNNYVEIPSKEGVLNIVKLNNLWSRTKDEEKLIANFNIPEFWNYLKHKFETKGKSVVSVDDFNRAKKSVEILLNHKFTHSYFKKYKSVEHHYQISFEIKYKSFTFRGILDKMTIDRKEKKVYFEDIKTGEGKSYKFMESFLKYRYYFQGFLYQQAFDYLSKIYNFEDYTLMPFRFIYISKSEDNPIVFVMSDKWQNASQKGFTTQNGYNYRGFDECLDLIYYHWKNKKYDFPKEIDEQNGLLLLNDNFININD